jgi:hypothetical protein
MRDDFAVFIITHGRPDNQMTLSTLKRGNYSGKTYFIVDDEDETKDRYIQLYGAENVRIFHKSEWFDIGDNLQDHKGVPVYARNECFRIAKELGIKYFVQLDDDYPIIIFRYDDGGTLRKKDINNFDALFEAMCDFLALEQITCIAFGVEGDFIGGSGGKYRERIYPNARNSFFCKTDQPFEFLGRVNEDVSTPAWHNTIGRLFMTILDVMVVLYDHEKNSGGSTEQYRKLNLFWNYFYPILYVPSAIKMSDRTGKINKLVNYNAIVPKIINERWKKHA